MYYVYVLRSADDQHRYVGHCKNLKVRLNQHNSLKVKATKPFAPWKIVYYVEFKSREEAITKERYFKTGFGRKWLNNQNI